MPQHDLGGPHELQVPAPVAQPLFLPPYFHKVNRHGIEVRIIAAQGVVITLIAALYAFIPSVSHSVLILAGILAIGIVPPLLMDRLRRPSWKAVGDGSAPPPPAARP